LNQFNDNQSSFIFETVWSIMKAHCYWRGNSGSSRPRLDSAASFLAFSTDGYTI